MDQQFLHRISTVDVFRARYDIKTIYIPHMITEAFKAQIRNRNILIFLKQKIFDLKIISELILQVKTQYQRKFEYKGNNTKGKENKLFRFNFKVKNG